MKNLLKALGIIALVAVIGFSMAACGGGDGGGGGGGGGGGSSGNLPLYIQYRMYRHTKGPELVFFANKVEVYSSKGSMPATYTYKNSSWEGGKILLHFKTSGGQEAFVVVEESNPTWWCELYSASFSEIGIPAGYWNRFDPVINGMEFELKRDTIYSSEYYYYLGRYYGPNNDGNVTDVKMVTIPSKIDINGLPVTGIYNGVFSSCANLNTITIPDSIISILYDAFSNTAWLNNKSTGLVYAGKVAYTYKDTMPANTNIQFLNDTKGIASYAFYGCTNLTNVTIPNSVINIGSNAFQGCTGLTTVTIPNSVINIGSDAFRGCTGLTTVTIPNSVSIGDAAFIGCTNLTSVTLGKDVTLPYYNYANPFPGDLRDKYYAGGKGTYTRTSGSSDTWTKKSS